MSGAYYTKWYWSDWRSDEGLRICSYAAKGLWADMLAIMSVNGGYLRINGRPLTNAQIAKSTNGTAEEVEVLLVELRTNHVFSETRGPTPAIYNRRMVRDAKKRDKCVEAGQKGVALKREKQKRNFTTLEGEGQGLYQIPDTRSQKVRKKEPAHAEAGGASVALPKDDWPSDAFERFWFLFPNKVGKPVALKAFDKVRRKGGVDWEHFLAGLHRYVNKTDSRNWLNPSTFLNQERWDEQPAPQPGSGDFPRAGGGRPGENKVTPAMLARGDFRRDR